MFYAETFHSSGTATDGSGDPETPPSPLSLPSGELEPGAGSDLLADPQPDQPISVEAELRTLRVTRIVSNRVGL